MRKRTTKYYLSVLLLFTPLVGVYASAHGMRYTTGVQEVGIARGNFFTLSYRHYVEKRIGLQGAIGVDVGALCQHTDYQSPSFQLSGLYHLATLLTDLLYFNVLGGFLLDVRRHEVAKYKHKKESHLNWGGMVGAELAYFMLERLSVCLCVAPTRYFLDKGYEKYTTRFSVGVKWIW